MSIPRRHALIWLTAVLATDLGSVWAEEVYRQQASASTWRTLTAAELDKWRSQGWTIQAETLPQGWEPLGQKGNLRLLADGAAGRAVRFSGELSLPGLRLPGSGWLVVSVEARRGPVSLSGPVYGGPKGGHLGWIVLPPMENGTEWVTLTGVCRADFPADSGVPVRVGSDKGVDLRGVAVRWYASPLDAYRSAFELFRKPMPNLVKNGDFEQVERMPAEDVARWRGKGWNLGDGDPVTMAREFGPNGAWDNKILRLVQERAAANGGENCLLTDLVTGGGFSARPDRQYRFSLWARGEGALSIFCHAYGGEKGGFVGNLPVVSGDSWRLGQDWRSYETIVPLKLEDFERLGVLPVISAPGKAWLDDFAVYELETADTMRATVARQRSRLRETLEDQVQVGPRQKGMIEFLLSEATRLCDLLAADRLSEGAADKVAALEYVTPRLKSVIEFGDEME